MSKVVPVPLLSLFSAYELETMVCGSPDIPLTLLKSVATYKGLFCIFVISVEFNRLFCRNRRNRTTHTMVLGSNGRIYQSRTVSVFKIRLGTYSIT